MTDQGSPESRTAPADHQAHLFLVRLWWEPGDCGTSGEWRGSVEHVATREKRYFRDTATLVEFIAVRVGWKARAPPDHPGGLS